MAMKTTPPEPILPELVDGQTNILCPYITPVCSNNRKCWLTISQNISPEAITKCFVLPINGTPRVRPDGTKYLVTNYTGNEREEKEKKWLVTGVQPYKTSALKQNKTHGLHSQPKRLPLFLMGQDSKKQDRTKVPRKNAPEISTCQHRNIHHHRHRDNNTWIPDKT